jgi:UPF0042 nucleotide-binding protein
MPSSCKFLIITGMSGAGKSFALKCLEDQGFFCVDNIPTELLLKFGELVNQSNKGIKKFACVVDVRDKTFTKNIVKVLLELDDIKINYEIVFLECDDNVLMRRFNETRRPHPLSKTNISKGIAAERILLQEVKGLANLIIKTTDFTIKDFKKYISNQFTNITEDKKLNVNIISFGFKKGIPENADLVIDVRFLPNPYYIEELAPKTGNDKEIRDYIFKWSITQKFLDKFFDFISFLLPNYVKEGKTYLTIGIGCTGGQHRSVMVASLLYEFIQSLKAKDIMPILEHRELEN